MFSGMESAWNEEIKREGEREREIEGDRERECVRKEKGENPQRF